MIRRPPRSTQSRSSAASDVYKRQEILPQVRREYNFTDDPNGRGIGGTSSGGICAWTVAWERPEAFRSVLSFVGSFENLAGGHNYPSLIRRTPPKPIRIFL